LIWIFNEKTCKMMKLPTLFNKTPRHKRFSYTPRFYDPVEEERKEREKRIREELRLNDEKESISADYKSRIAGSFRTAGRGASRQSDPSASLLRIAILLVLSIWVVGYLQFGSAINYMVLAFVPVYLFLKFRKR
jgi:hypothetical protein